MIAVMLYASVDTGSCDALRFSGHSRLWCFMLQWTQAVVVLYASVDTGSCDALQPQVVVMLYASVNTGAAPEGQQNTQHLPNQGTLQTLPRLTFLFRKFCV